MVGDKKRPAALEILSHKLDCKSVVFNGSQQMTTTEKTDWMTELEFLGTELVQDLCAPGSHNVDCLLRDFTITWDFVLAYLGCRRKPSVDCCVVSI